ncbi:MULTISPECIES: DUF1684 domain-containing protein [unclassified Kaistella]|uniref:DUF1684 domain-containing protein n=1 Tax=unclassified Kaistella TaxID=2762626 RepID=UPI002732A475|nr:MULTISPECIES: DUF1684 domain-containing protein [unclassified Kaistella]MDP2455175.1 DUF1684 domain-containing protein [Kaistella sp. SH11-4b]MDP2458149.1 DUF1684 domain-containing protein [Kaistella sp. SH40-3]MDP2460942.1 DUF1684 domain-containing protein [Kaistella sp. SH19-2b]
MKNILILLISFLAISCVSQPAEKETADIKKFQNQLNAEYRNPKKTPLRGSNFSDFKEHPFFPINLKYKIAAKFTKTENTQSFELPTSSGKTRTYREFGKATFVLEGQELTLTLYQNLALIKKNKYKDHLFLPFRDATKSIETYGGGKYMDLKIPTGEVIVLDFNKSYHPYCAYNAFDYNCPIVPAENILPIRIEAGVMYEDVYHH